jgi:hypothetical protein
MQKRTMANGAKERSPEEWAVLYGKLDKINGSKPYRPRLVCVDGKVVGNCIVKVGPDDPNWFKERVGGGFDGRIQVGPRVVGWWEPGWEWKYRVMEK